MAPAVTTLLFLAIFTLALGRAVQVIGGVPFVEFLAPGLIIMAIIQNAYANTVSSVMISKIQGQHRRYVDAAFVSRRVYYWFRNGWRCARDSRCTLRRIVDMDFSCRCKFIISGLFYSTPLRPLRSYRWSVC